MPTKTTQPDTQPSERPEPTAAEWETRRQALLAKVPPKDQRPKKLVGKLAQILGLIGTVEKRGYNAFHRYNYAKESDLVEAVRPLLSEYGIFFWWTVTDHTRRTQVIKDRDKNITGEAETLTVLDIEWKFIDGETGEETPVEHIIAYGDDPGDKGVYKALTGGVKYILMKTFMIATGDDPERDEATDRRSQSWEASSRVDVRRGQPQGRPKPQDQPAPGGRQQQANAPAERQLSDLLAKAGIHRSEDAARLISDLLGEPVVLNEADKAGSLAAFLTKLKEDRQKYGKLIFDLRKHVEAGANTAAPGTDATTRAMAQETEEDIQQELDAAAAADEDLEAGEAV